LKKRSRIIPERVGSVVQRPAGNETPERRAQCVLAVLVLASVWKVRFPDGWVTDEEFGEFSRHIPSPKDADLTRRDTIKRYIRDALQAVAALDLQAVVQRRTVTKLSRVKDKRERVTRLKQPLQPQTLEWFTRHGLHLLEDGAQKIFDDTCYDSLTSSDTAATALNEGVVYSLLERNDLELAAAHAKSVLRRASSDHERRTFHLALATIDVHRHAAAPLWEKGPAMAHALSLLRSMVRGHTTLETPSERVLQTRILTTLASAIAIHELDRMTHETEEARIYLKMARDLIPPSSLSEQGDLLFAEAMVEEQESIFQLAIGGDRELGYTLRYKAASSLLAAITAWRLSQRWDRLRHGVRFLYALPFALTLAHIENAKAGLIFRWLHAAHSYFKVVAPQDSYVIEAIRSAILDLFQKLPVDCGADALPLPLNESYDLVNECVSRRGPRTKDPALSELFQRKWYLSERKSRDKKKGRPP